MNSIIAFLAVQCLVALVMISVWVFPPRPKMERRARRILAVHPNAEQKFGYLSFPSVIGKRALMEANPWRTLRSLGGG